MEDAGNTVKITINIVDANSGAAVGQTTRNLNQLGAAGTTAGTQVAAGGAKGAAGIRLVSDAGVAVGKSVTDSMTMAVGAIGTLVPASAQVQQAFGQIGTTAEQAAQRTVKAGGEMQQMLANIQRAQQKMGQPLIETNRWQGPMRKQSADLADSFAGLGTARGEMAQLGDQFAMLPAKAASCRLPTHGLWAVRGDQSSCDERGRHRPAQPGARDCQPGADQT